MRKLVRHAIAIVAVAACTAVFADPAEHPDEAVCRTCEIRGGGHGLEKVAAHREYEGTFYYFCDPGCADAFDAFPEAYAHQPLPRPAPDVTFTSLDGSSVPPSALRGQHVLVDFWATWCKPCVTSIPKLVEIQEEFGERGLRVVGVSIDEIEADRVRAFVDEKNMAYTVALDGGDEPAWLAYRVAAIPAAFLVDPDGRIVAEWKGAVDPSRIRAEIADRLGGTD